MKTLEEAKNELLSSMKEGSVCSCCGQLVKLYKRPITSAMAIALIYFYNEFEKNPQITMLHAESFFKDQDVPASIRGDFPKLRYWGLIQQSQTGKGWYTTTSLGDRFVKCNATVASHVRLYNNKFYGLTGGLVSIKDCLKNKFNYEKLMNNTL